MRSQASSSTSLPLISMLIGGLLLLLALPGVSSAEEAKKPDTLQIAGDLRTLVVQDIDENSISPLAPPDGHYSLLIFTATECPIANAFSPEISRISSEFEDKNITVFLVYTDPELDATMVRAHIAEYELKPVVPILDIAQVLAQATGATHTPEAAVIDSTGNQLYRGRINNRYAALGKARRVITQHDLRSALESIIAGNPIPVSRNEVIGCYLPTPPAP
ncbi:MAG: hypothetical protein ACI9R3_000483 [Verrucomicrobiales bacterium]|jgi:hypothetical protein